MTLITLMILMIMLAIKKPYENSDLGALAQRVT
jgi:hypothetical protein